MESIRQARECRLHFGTAGAALGRDEAKLPPHILQEWNMVPLMYVYVTSVAIVCSQTSIKKHRSNPIRKRLAAL